MAKEMKSKKEMKKPKKVEKKRDGKADACGSTKKDCGM